MRFTDKVVDSITASMDDMRNDIHSEFQNMSREVAALASLGMLAFALISIVAVTALVKAGKK
jgi:hypothetical protein